MERQEYPAMLPQLQPGQAVDIVNDRVRQINSLNTSLADWLQERRRLEEQYSAGLSRLAQKQINDAELGIFSVPWTTLTSAAGTMAESHSALAAKIEVDVEQPLRNFASSNREMQAMTTIQGNLAEMAKDVEKARQKLDKIQSKGDRAEAGRAATASSELETAQSQWDSQAPYVFENLQAVDETRLNHLRDVLTQFQTHEVDLVQKSQSTAEHCLNVLLSLQTEDEIKTFVLKALSGRVQAERPHRSSSAQASGPSRTATTSSTNLTPTISQPEEDGMRSNSIQDEKKKNRFGGLRRLGTVVGGKRRESRIPPGLPPMSESPERKPKSSPFGGRFGRNKDASMLELPGEPSSRDRPFSPLRMGSEVLEPPNASAPPASSSPAEKPREAPQVNGTAATIAGASQLPIPNGSHQSDLADLEPPKPRSSEPEPQQDAEGYSVPPQSLDTISQAQAEAAAAGGEQVAPAFNVSIRDAPINDDENSSAALESVANKLQAPPSVASKTGTVRGRRQRPVSTIGGTLQDNSFAEASPPSSQSKEAPAALSLAPPSQTTSPVPNFPSPTNAIAPGVSGAAAGAAFPSIPASPTGQQQPLFKPASALVDQPTGDTGSIRSGRSLTSTTSQALRHPELHGTGLQSSIVETISARFEEGKVVSSSVIGEIALAYNPPDFSSPFGSETIRLENFAMLEKVAPNTAFINQLPDKEGEYTVNMASIAKTQVAFKYQVQTEESGTHAPLLIVPAFKIEPNQTSVIISYSLAPSFALHGRDSITLSNVMLALTLEGAKATGCLSKPVGTFSREKNLIWWQLGEITLQPGAAPEKLLARFTTESQATSGAVEARWEIAGNHATGLGSGLAVSVHSQSGGSADGADPFADDGATGLTAVWKGVEGVKKLTSGAYSAR